MSKAIKVIDLLNKIANGKELPEEIKYDNTIWQYNKTKTDYYQDIGSTKLYFFAELVVYNKSWLNDTVEIIEEQEEIDIQKLDENIKYYNIIGYSENEKMLFNMIQDTANKINKLVQAVKQLDKKIKEKK